MPLFTGVRAAQAVPNLDQDRFQKGCGFRTVIKFCHDLGLHGAVDRSFRSVILPKGVLGLAPATWFR